jgi:hypothetical protein
MINYDMSNETPLPTLVSPETACKMAREQLQWKFESYTNQELYNLVEFAPTVFTVNQRKEMIDWLVSFEESIESLLGSGTDK